MKPAPHEPAPLVSVIIPNWNGARFLPTCLDALKAQTYLAVEVLVVDNASQDESLELLKRDYAWVRLVELATNEGFTGACNAGMRAAQGEFVSLLNNDTEVDPNWIAAVIDAFNRYPEAGSVASKMLLFDQRDRIHTTGDYFTLDGRAGNRGVWETDSGQYDQEDFVFSASGGSAIYRRAMLDKVGLLDDDFFFSMEDVDLGWRAQLAGWRCLYTPQAIVYHHLSATGGGVTASYHDGRNLIYVLVKNYPSDLWKRYRRPILRAQWRLAVEALSAWRGEAARARLRGMLAGIVAIPRLQHKRRAVQALRVVSAEYLESILTPPSTGATPTND